MTEQKSTDHGDALLRFVPCELVRPVDLGIVLSRIAAKHHAPPPRLTDSRAPAMPDECNATNSIAPERPGEGIALDGQRGASSDVSSDVLHRHACAAVGRAS
jgi:hypothetical protein